MGKSRKGVSRKVQVSISGRRQTLNQARIAEQHKHGLSKYLTTLKGLSNRSVTALNDISRHTESISDNLQHDDFIITAPDNADDEWEDEEVSGMTDGNVFLAAVKEILETRTPSQRFRRDQRTWRQRIEAQQRAWEPLIEPLATLYVEWKYPSNRSSPNSSHTPQQSNHINYDFTIEILDLYTLERSATITRDTQSKSPALDLIRAGFLSGTPESPSIAVSLRTLELLHVIRLHRASFSIEAFTKVLCYLNTIPYRRYYRTVISDAFDVYLAIQQIVKHRVDNVLGYDKPNYRVLNSCPACCYELKDEPPLRFNRIFVMDGNNSLKRIARIGQRQVADHRVFNDSDYFLPHDYVNRFANEVNPTPKPPPVDDDDDNDDAESPEGDPTDGGVQSGCTDNWKAAAHEAKKRTWEIFDEAGIFASACRHGCILWLADMVRSGELAKYPLAMIRRALDLFKAPFMAAYDIGCSFEGTITTTSLGSDFEASKSRCCVNAFHGYAHNFLCQLHYHPRNIEGMGIEDVETLERVFSQSNVLAPLTRYMSAYHRRLFIDMFFAAWDADKYQNLGSMLYENYCQALDIIDQLAVDVSQRMKSLNLTAADLDRYQQDQFTYFQQLGKESDEDLHAVSYVELLEEIRVLRRDLENASSRFNLQTPSDYHFLAPNKSYGVNLSATRKAETEKRKLKDKLERLSDEVIELEVAMNITNRWQPTDQQYINTMRYLSQRKYEKALDKLQKLVIQRLFELQKMNLSQTAYKMRVYIAKSLQKRSKAIRRAVQAYNAAAVKVNRDTLDWEKVSHYSFLDQFHLLRDVSHAVEKEQWANQLVQDLMKDYQRLKRAREEIDRCNIEVRRVHTSIIDENASFHGILSQLRSTQDPMLGPVEEYIKRRQGSQTIILSRLHQLYQLDGFTGNSSIGVHILSAATESEAHNLIVENEIEEAEEEDDQDIEHVGGLVDYIADLSVQ